MIKNLGFTRFEFYFVVSVIGLIVLFATQRYSLLVEETKRLTFETLAKNFNAAVYNHHARWIMVQQPEKLSQIKIDDVELYFSPQGWPLAVIQKDTDFVSSPVKNCLSLWKNLLQNSPPISYNNESTKSSSTYHLSLRPKGACRFELIGGQSQKYYFDYNPQDGKVTIHSSSDTKNL